MILHFFYAYWQNAEIEFCFFFNFLLHFFLFAVAFPKGTYYTSITNFMQGYIDNQINLDASHTCANTCSDHKLTGKNYDCHNDTICAHHNFQKTRCTGEVFDCSSIESDGSVCLVVSVWPHLLSAQND